MPAAAASGCVSLPFLCLPNLSGASLPALTRTMLERGSGKVAPRSPSAEENLEGDHDAAELTSAELGQFIKGDQGLGSLG